MNISWNRPRTHHHETAAHRREFIETVVSHVGEHELLSAIQTGAERNELLWSNVRASMATGIEGKRTYLATVVANAMIDTTKIDDAQLIVKALTELDGPQFRALVKLVAADDANQADPGNSDEILQAALEAIPAPVLATLVRVGVVYIGSEQRGNGLFSVPRARTYSIPGVNDFGRELLANLCSVEIDWPLVHRSSSVEMRGRLTRIAGLL